ncbi:hypothetical protein [Streptomyces sp. SID161]|uniref:hypothetical protein n=1 Tax=Streptomyces sp. SID161 TaxID=2690251 RepID=UPI00136D44D8|nr:hypothetical protein [Streptomyces sp. SID161]MYW47471.1 hypothetical protein [Streptomyces sp. SID161]
MAPARSTGFVGTAGPASVSAAAAASSDDGIDLNVCDFDLADDLPYEVLADIEKKYGSDVADGVEYQRMRMGSSDIKEAADHALPGVGRNLEDTADYFRQWRSKQTHIDTDTKNPVAYDEDRKLIIISQPHRIHAYKKSYESSHDGGRYEPIGQDRRGKE